MVLKAGEQVKILRERVGMTVQDLAKKANVSRPFIYTLEGGGDVRLTTLTKVCKALGVSMKTLFATERGRHTVKLVVGRERGEDSAKIDTA